MENIVSPQINEITYSVSRYEQTGDQLFIRLESTNNPVYLEHFFTQDEQQDVPGTIEGLVAQLQVLDDNYVAPTPMVSLMDAVSDVIAQVDMNAVAVKKTALIAKNQAILNSAVNNVVASELSVNATQPDSAAN